MWKRLDFQRNGQAAGLIIECVAFRLWQCSFGFGTLRHIHNIHVRVQPPLSGRGYYHQHISEGLGSYVLTTRYKNGKGFASRKVANLFPAGPFRDETLLHTLSRGVRNTCLDE